MSRVKGHTLADEGAPYLANEQGQLERQWKLYGGVSGKGRGLCSCGAVSPILPSAYQRKKWHRAHKSEGLPS
jgi:hypothetical protein